MAASHRQTQPGVPSPSAPEGAPGGDGARSAIAEHHVRISIRVLGVLLDDDEFNTNPPTPCLGKRPQQDQNPKALAGRGGRSPWPDGARWRVLVTLATSGPPRAREHASKVWKWLGRKYETPAGFPRKAQAAWWEGGNPPSALFLKTPLNSHVRAPHDGAGAHSASCYFAPSSLPVRGRRLVVATIGEKLLCRISPRLSQRASDGVAQAGTVRRGRRSGARASSLS